MNYLIHRLLMRVAGLMARMLPSADRLLFAGENSSSQLCRHIVSIGYQRVLVVTDKPLRALGIVDKATDGLGPACVGIYDGVLPDPTFEIVQNGLVLAHEKQADAILAIGGGSVIDCAKVIAALATNPGNGSDYIGFNKFKEKPLALFTIPTTAGTGSEATIGAIISDDKTHQKSIITDAGLAPVAAAIDASLMMGLPPHITAATGMDALTHAIEAWVGIWEHGNYENNARLAVRQIFKYLPIAVSDGANIEAREAMAYAAWCAGLAINKVNVGNVHAIAHQLGAYYKVPHGLANAVVLPLVLARSLPAIEKKLAVLAKDIGLEGCNDEELAQRFVAQILELNQQIGIGTQLSCILRQDIPNMAEAAAAEGKTMPVPVLFDKNECAKILGDLAV